MTVNNNCMCHSNVSRCIKSMAKLLNWHEYIMCWKLSDLIAHKLAYMIDN